MRRGALRLNVEATSLFTRVLRVARLALVSGEPGMDDDVISVVDLVGHLFRSDDLEIAELMHPRWQQEAASAKITHHAGPEQLAGAIRSKTCW